MTDQELADALAASPSPHRITEEYIQSRIKCISYIPPEDTKSSLTICVITLDNGFEVTGESACADLANYNQEIGEEIAERDARRKLWPLFGFALKEALHLSGKGAETTPQPQDGVPTEADTGYKDCE